MKSLTAVAFIFFSVLAFASQDVSFWSFRYLARASNSLLVASQQSLNQQKVICGIKGEKVSVLSQSLKALVDEKISKLNENQKHAIRSQAGSCVSECSCDIYSYYLEQSQDPSDRAALALLANAHQKVNELDRMQCARKFSEFCTSQLLKTISK